MGRLYEGSCHWHRDWSVDAYIAIRKGSTLPTLDKRGDPLPGSVSTLEKVELGSLEQAVDLDPGV
jgi:hypothetical protein